MPSKVQVETATVKIGQYKVVTYSYGLRDDVFFLLNGGPGLPCDYLRDPLVAMVDKGLSHCDLRPTRLRQV
jgi:proline iminopeptidase